MAISPRLLRPRAAGGFDADAQVYFNAVAIADGQQLEPAVKKAISDFVRGCKADGIWAAIKASCILMGARTLSGALTPLVGASPTNVNFVSGDYDRKTGLIGNASSKYINSGRANNADPQDDNHNAVYVTSLVTANNRAYLGTGAGVTGGNQIFRGTLNAVERIVMRNRRDFLIGVEVGYTIAGVGFHGQSRSSPSEFVARLGNASTTTTMASQTPATTNVDLFRLGSFGFHGDGRIAFYSIGTSLDLAKLDSRISTLYTAIGAAI